MAVATGAHRVGQQHPVEPAVDDPVAGAKGDAAALSEEVGQILLRLQVHRLGIGGGMAEALHHQVGGESQTGQLLHLVPGHRPGGVLGADGGHQWFAAGTGTHASETAGFAHHLLGQGEALSGVRWCTGTDEQIGGCQAELGAHFVGEGAADHQGNAAACTNLIADGAGLQFEPADHRAVFFDRAGMGTDGDHITGVQACDVTFDRQSPGVFSGVEEDRCDFASEDHPTRPFVGHMRDVIAGVPQHGVDGALAGAAGAHHIAHVGHGVTVLFERGDGLQAIRVPSLQHRQSVKGDIRACGGVGGRGEVVGVGFSLHLEHRHGDRFGKFRP